MDMCRSSSAVNN